jgi:predicted DCC family thiol-disulfide oxidoreductase YuxK
VAKFRERAIRQNTRSTRVFQELIVVDPANDPKACSDESETLTIVYDGECPACAFLFEDIVVLRQRQKNIKLIDARENADLARALEAEYGISFDREFGARVNGVWYFGGAALNAVLFSARIRQNWLKQLILFSLKLVYPLLRSGRGILLRLKGVAPLRLGR